MFEPDTSSFDERLEIGNKKEKLLLEMFNKIGIKAESNNEDNVKDIDIFLTEAKVYVDVKFMKTPFYFSFRQTGIQPFDCLTVTKRHILAYDEKEKSTGKEVWIACFIKYDDYDIKELKFFRNSFLVELANKNDESKIHFNRKHGINLKEFVNNLLETRDE